MHKIDGKLQLYGFEKHIPAGMTAQQVRDELVMLPGVRFAAVYTGAILVFAAAEATSLKATHRAIGERYVQAGFRTDWSTMILPSRIAAPKRGSPRYSAIVRAQVEDDPETVLARIDDRFEDRHKADRRHVRFFYGGAVLTGQGFDVLIEFGSDREQGLWPLVQELRGVRGVGRTDTSFADLLDNARLSGGRPWKPTAPVASADRPGRATRTSRRRR